MSMKSLSTPRRCYIRNGVLHVLWGGTIFGVPADKSVIKTVHPLRIEKLDDGSIRVTQRAPKKKGVSEVWGPTTVPSKARATA